MLLFFTYKKCIFIRRAYITYASAIVTSTSTPGSIEIEVICFTISEGECKSITRLWIPKIQKRKILENFSKTDNKFKFLERFQIGAKDE